MTEEQLNNQLTQLWQRMVAAENKTIELEKTIQILTEYSSKLEIRIRTLEVARTKQIEINTQLLNWKADPDKDESASSWWKKLVG